MADLSNLEHEIKEKLARSDERRQLGRDHLQQRMAETEARHQRYTAQADHLMKEVIRPRMEKLVSFFDNAKMPEARNSRHNYCCQFEPTPRFPAMGMLEMGVTRDGEFRTLVLQYELEILPSSSPSKDRTT